jgi:hypothetical protein
MTHWPWIALGNFLSFLLAGVSGPLAPMGEKKEILQSMGQKASVAHTCNSNTQRLRQEDCKFKANMGYIETLC